LIRAAQHAFFTVPSDKTLTKQQLPVCCLPLELSYMQTRGCISRGCTYTFVSERTLALPQFCVPYSIPSTADFKTIKMASLPTPVQNIWQWLFVTHCIK